MAHVTTKIITEERIRRSLATLIAMIFLALVLLGFAARSLLRSLDTVQIASADSLTKTRAEAVVTELARHTESDMRILRLLATFFDTAHHLQTTGDVSPSYSVNTMLTSLHRLGFPSDFLSILWYGNDGDGLHADIASGVIQATRLSEDTVVMQEVIADARVKGETVSEVHFDPILQRRVVIYAQAVFDQNGVQGVVAGVHGLKETQVILDEASATEEHYSYFLVDASATFVASAAASGYPEIIYYTQGAERIALPIFPPESRSQIQRVNQGFITIRQDERAYHGYIQPLNFVDIELRLICINTDLNASSLTNQQIANTKLIFAVFCLTVVLAVLLGAVLTYSYGNRLIRFLYFDMLTGADNSNRFRRKLSNRLDKSFDDYLSVATLNVRQFRSINEIFGVESANSLLIIIKQTLSERLDRDEFFCRASNDLFHVCLHDGDKKKIRARLEAIMSEVVQRYLETHDYRLKMYAGVVILDSDDIGHTPVSEVFMRLSLALTKAKEDITETVFFYEESLYVKEETENYIETHMETALAGGDFKMYLQPKMDLASGTVGGAEALVRWAASGDGRMIFPDQFIPLFNRNGFCVKLDMYMLEQACLQMRAWIDSGIEPVPISVNQSRLLFFEADYVDNVSAIAAKYSIPPGLITLEVLEEMYLEKTDEVNTKIAELRKRGFLISMDDFGSGYSSFSAIGELSVDELKLDRKFLMTASGSESWRMKIVIDQVVRMARRLHLSVVAEGVETKEDEQLIKSLGCDYGQGYYYCRPIPAAEFNERYMINQKAQVLDDDDDEEPFSPELS